MNPSQWMKTLVVALALAGSVQGCSADKASTTIRATSREIRGYVPVRAGALRILRIIALNAKTRRVVAQAVPGVDGTFVITGVTVGATYHVNAIVGRRSIPVTFPRSRGSADKSNLFEIGTKDSPVVGATEGPIDLGVLVANADSFDTPPDHAPNLQEDYDEDGIPDGEDPDIDGDGVPNAMDTDEDRDGVPDRIEFDDMDGDGLTNEADPDVDGDGIPNSMDPDNDNDGIPDAMDPTPDGTSGNPPDDNDGDGLPNSEDDTPNGEDAPVSPAPDAGVPKDGGVPDDGSAPEDGGVPEDAGARKDASSEDGGFEDAGSFDA